MPKIRIRLVFCVIFKIPPNLIGSQYEKLIIQKLNVTLDIISDYHGHTSIPAHRIPHCRQQDQAKVRVADRGEQVLGLPKKEFELLYKLLSYPGQIFTRNQLLDDIWGFDSESGEDTVKTHISRLRNKLRAIEEFRIITIKGLGYKAEVLE